MRHNGKIGGILLAIQLGMPSLIEFGNIDETVELCQRLKLNFVELNMNLPQYCPESLISKTLKDICKDTGIAFTVHLPEEIDLGSFQPSIRRGYIERCKEIIHWASEAGVKLINLHLNSGIYFTLPEKKEWIYDRHSERFMANLDDAFRQLLPVAQRANVTICIENCGNLHLPFMQQAIEHLLILGDLKLTWDVGHDAKVGYKEQHVLLKHEARIWHMHLHDFDGVSDHRPLFSGNIDIKRMVNYAEKLNIGVVVEVKTVSGLVDSVNLLASLLGRHYSA